MEFQNLLDKFQGVTPEIDGFVAICPSHNDSKPSLRITVANSKALLKCRAGCKTSDVIAAVGLTFGDLSNMTGSADMVSNTEPLSEFHLEQAKQFINNLPLSETALTYAKERFGVTGVLAATLKLGSYVSRSDGSDERLMVPFCDPEGVIRGYQGRALSPDAQVRWLGPRNPDNSSWSKLGYFHGGSDDQEVLVTEGPGDALTAAAAGYDSIAVRGAAQGNIADTIKEWIKGRPAVVIGDGDEAGGRFAARLSEELINIGVTVRTLPMREGTDLADWYSESPETFQDDLIKHISRLSDISLATAVQMSRDEVLFPLTDLGNARFVAAISSSNGQAIRFAPQMGWLIASDGVWRHDNLGTVRSIVQQTSDLVKRIAETMAENALTIPAQSDAKRWNGWSKYCQSTRGIDAAIKELQSLRSVATDISEFDSHVDLLAVKNGVVDLTTGDLLETDNDLLLTRRIEVNYRPDAVSDMWTKFLSEVMQGDLEMVDYLQRLVGYGITGHNTEQAFSVLWGTGANGKTVFTATLTHVFRSVTTVTPFSTFEKKASGGIPNDIAALLGARIAMASEGEADRPMAEALLKSMTGSEPVTARFLHKEFFTFTPTFLLMLATNNKPNFKGQDEGLWRRVKMIEFNRFFKPEERDHKLQQNLQGQAEGILNWAIQGSVEWYRRGLDDPLKIMEATGDYRANSDPMVGFLPGMYSQDVDAVSAAGSVIFSDYLDWSQEENLKPQEIVTRRKFFSMLEERGLHKRIGHGNKTVFDGIRKSRPSDNKEKVTATVATVSGGADLEDL